MCSGLFGRRRTVSSAHDLANLHLGVARTQAVRGARQKYKYNSSARAAAHEIAFNLRPTAIIQILDRAHRKVLKVTLPMRFRKLNFIPNLG